MAKDRSAPLDEATFHCRDCRRSFSCRPVRVEDDPDPEAAHHPFRYFAECPDCGSEVAQAAWQRSLLKAWANATGPRTPEGLAATGSNLAGHPTPEEAQRTRFNAMKHGLSARTATYFPAKPDGYSFCAGCEVDRFWCRDQPACVKQTQLFMLHQAAFEQRNPKHLMGIYSSLHAAVLAVLQQILQKIIADGVTIEAPQYYTDKEGVLIIAKYLDDDGRMRTIKDLEAHPLFRPLGELISRVGLSLTDLGMTPRVIEDGEEEMGRLSSRQQSREALEQFSRQTAESMSALRDLVSRAAARRDADPVLIEHKQQNEAG